MSEGHGDCNGPTERVPGRIDFLRGHPVCCQPCHAAAIASDDEAAENGNAERAAELAACFRQGGGGADLLRFDGSHDEVGGQGECRCEAKREDGIADHVDRKFGLPANACQNEKARRRKR
ncbi:hypothetical protein [Pararhizobium sp. PWRC1-1]|uniref:hypothetical protein n=1 Tax=Pararhizobium sp. PWRC1-1 TaxID=2804566 RepID=UPI003CFB7C83